MHLPIEKQIHLKRLLKQKRNVDRFMFRRGRACLALELGVSEPTIRNVDLYSQRLGKLTPDQVKYVKRMRFEYNKHKEEAKQWTLDSIAGITGVSVITVRRWYQKILRGEL